MVGGSCANYSTANRGRTDRHLWARNYERNLSDILALQSEVSQAVAEEIRVKMTASEKARLAKFHPVKREAYEAYLRGSAEATRSSSNALSPWTRNMRRLMRACRASTSSMVCLVSCAST